MINRDKLYTYINKYHGNLQPSTNGWYTCDCFICGKKGKFAVNFTYLIAKCWTGCFNGFIIDAIRMYHGINYFECLELIDSQPEQLMRIPSIINAAARNAKIKLPNGYHPILEGSGSLAVRARDYLTNRGFDLNKMDRLGVGYVDIEDPNPLENYFGRIIVPLKRDGVLMYFLGRTFIDDYMRYKNPSKEICGVGKSELFFGEENLYLNKAVFLTEGWACAATMGNAISMQGSVFSVIQRNNIIKSPVEQINITTDANFYQNGLAMARVLLPHKKVKVLNLDWFEQNKIGKDPNSVGKENILNLEKETSFMDQRLLYMETKRYSKVLKNE
jgi:hypothetical protein